MGYVYDSFIQEYRNIANDMVDYKECERSSELEVWLKDGTKLLYNSLTRGIRSLPVDPNNLTDEEFRREFSNRMLKAMNRKGVGQNELSRRTGIPQAQISRYANGMSLPRIDTMDKIAKALESSIDDFLYT